MLRSTKQKASVVNLCSFNTFSSSYFSFWFHFSLNCKCYRFCDMVGKTIQSKPSYFFLLLIYFILVFFFSVIWYFLAKATKWKRHWMKLNRMLCDCWVLKMVKYFGLVDHSNLNGIAPKERKMENRRLRDVFWYGRVNCKNDNTPIWDPTVECFRVHKQL